MKKGLLTLIISATIGIVHAQNVNIPDAIFKAVLVGNTAINTNGDTEIQVSEAAAFGGTIFCASLGISDLTGIEAFTALTVLNCSSNLITSLDVSQNTALISLNCSGDGYVQGQITSLDVSLNTALTEFYCFENQLDSLNISQNSALTTLWCYENQLDSLNVSQNPALTTLWCSNNQLTSLNLNQNTSLGDLNCAFNQLTYLDVANGNNTNMSNFYANNNPNLFCIDVDDVAWSTNNWTNIGAQTYFSTNCQAPPTTYVPDNNFEAYLEINGMGNGIPYDDSVFTSVIDTLTYLDLSMGAGSATGIFDLTGIEDFTALMYLNCSYNGINNPDLSNNLLLEDLIIGYNNMYTLDISANTELKLLECGGSFLDSLDVSNNIELVHLYCGDNNIVYLNGIQNLSNLNNLYCQTNFITDLDVSNNSQLDILVCDENILLTSLNLRNGNNINMSQFNSQNNPNLFCINVDDDAWSTTNWTVANGNIDSQHYFSNNCSSVPYDCTDSLEVTDVVIDNANLTMNIAIYNGYNSYLSMPYVAFTIDANGDTIQQGNMNLFGAINLDTSWYNYSLSSAITPAYPLTMYFVYVVSIGGSVTDTCILTYNSTPTSITDINLMGNRKLISIVDVLGRQNKGTKNELLFYIYDNGTVEKKIILE